MISYAEKMDKGRRLDERIAQIINDYENGSSLQRLAAKHQVSYSLIWQRLKKLGILRVGGNRTPQLRGKRFGLLLVIRKLEKRDKHGQTLWEARCDCGLISQRTSPEMRTSMSCGCRQNAPLRGRNWEEQCRITTRHWSTIIRNADLRGLGININKKDAWDIFLSQKGMCALTGRILIFGDQSNLATASLDRIDSKVGYKSGNLQWVHKDVNRMKGKLSDKRFVEFCREVVKHNEGRDF